MGKSARKDSQIMPLPFTLAPESVPIQPVNDPQYEAAGVQLWVKREDLIHPLVSGNKWRKLKYPLLEAQAQGHVQLLTFGGAYSNHLLAVAAAGEQMGFRTVGVVRGERAETLSPTLVACEDLGMQLHFVSRQAYKQRAEPAYQQQLVEILGTSYIIPEGGTNQQALRGVAEVWDSVPQAFDLVVTMVGTGGTLAGLALQAPQSTNLLGIMALKGYEDTMEMEIQGLLREATGFFPSAGNWRLEHDAHHGGYAKASPDLVAFVQEWPARHGFLLDPVYTGKLFYYLHHRICAGYFPRGMRILAIHTGGLQGIAGWNQRHANKLPTEVQ